MYVDCDFLVARRTAISSGVSTREPKMLRTRSAGVCSAGLDVVWLVLAGVGEDAEVSGFELSAGETAGSVDLGNSTGLGLGDGALRMLS